MKQFKNLFEVINYHPSCPFCTTKMSFGWDLSYDENSVKAYLKFGSTHLTVDCYTNRIIKADQVVSTSFVGGPVIQYMGSSLADFSASGTDIRRLNVSCDDCHKYGYF